jgi:fluoride exporter
VKELLAVALAGAFGAMARYGVALWAKANLAGPFPWGTWIANVVGCLLLGFFMQWTMDHQSIPKPARLAVATGFLGAFTTFSTFSYETVRAFQEGMPGVALANVAANLLVGLLFAFVGIQIARALV